MKPGEKTTAYEGDIIRVIKSIKPDGRVFEKAVRAPGTRIILFKPEVDKVLLSREYREEISDYDYRLPGGKVKDKIKEWDEIKNDQNIMTFITEAAIKEAREEVGMEIKDIKLYTISNSGGPTIEWTLYYFVSNNFTDLGKQSLEKGENISLVWLSSKEVIKLCLEGKLKEGRSTAALLQYFHSIGKI